MSRLVPKKERHSTEPVRDDSDLSNAQVWGLAAALLSAGVLGLVFVPQWMIVDDVPRLLEPLQSNGPVVIVAYELFALPSVIMTGIILVIMPIGMVTKRTYPHLSTQVEYVARSVTWLAIISLVWLAIAVPILGKATEFYVASQGYKKCDPLTHIAFGSYRPGYVKDPRLCVHHYQINEALKRHGYEPLPGN